jgi:hypothetical protein
VSKKFPKEKVMIARLFREHPASLGETYREHMATALSFAGPLAVAALAALVHAFLPFLFKTKASLTVTALHTRMTSRCRACPSGPKHRPDLFSRPALAGWDPVI